MKHDFIDKYNNRVSAIHKLDPRVKVYGHIAGGILLRSVDRSDYIYKAMISRGFAGEFPEGNTDRLKWPDLTAVVFFLILIAAAGVLWNI
jgi:cobalt/nickel transport system permease protein